MDTLANIQVNTQCVWGKKTKTVFFRLNLSKSFQKRSSQTEQIDSEATENCFRAKSFS